MQAIKFLYTTYKNAFIIRNIITSFLVSAQGIAGKDVDGSA